MGILIVTLVFMLFCALIQRLLIAGRGLGKGKQPASRRYTARRRYISTRSTREQDWVEQGYRQTANIPEGERDTFIREYRKWRG